VTVRTRFAPSPTGALHLGNARTAVLNWLFARHEDGRFVLRFEDTDVERNVEDAEGRVLESLDWLGLDRDEGPDVGGDRGPYRQSERGGRYRDRAERLLDRELAYHCYCLPEELEARREAALARGEQPIYDGRCRELTTDEEAELRAQGRTPSVRLEVDPGPVSFVDRARGEVSIRGGEFGDFVLLRSDGRPTYNFAVVVDDLLMEITHVIRGAGHLSNTPKQVLLYRAFGEATPEFVHVPLVLAPGGEKLSKREGAPGVLDYRDRGYHPDAVVNYLSLLAWSSESGDEYLTRERLVREIDLDRIGLADAEVDPEKMKWLSGLHLRAESAERRADRVAEITSLQADPGLSREEMVRGAELLADRVQLVTELADEMERIFRPPDRGAGEAREILAREGALDVVRETRRAWAGLDDWSGEGLDAALREAGDRTGASGRELYQPVRAALTGEAHGASLPTVARVLGRRRTLGRLDEAAGDGSSSEKEEAGEGNGFRDE